MSAPITLCAPAVPEPWTPAARRALAGLALAMLLASLGSSSANVALPALAQAFAVSLPQVQWVVLAYLLSMTVLSTLAGRLGDILGHRPLLLLGLGLFSAASLGCALAPSLPWLLAGRVVQGLGAALMMALTLALVSQSVPPGRTGSALGLLGTLSGLGTALGPSLGGSLLAYGGWPWVFALNTPLGLLTLGLAWRTLPAPTPIPTATRRQRLRQLDHLGASVLSASLLAYALALTWPGDGWRALGLLALAALGLALFALIERRSAQPLIQLTLLRQSGLGQVLLTHALVSTVIMSTMVVGPFYLGYGLGLDAAHVGWVMAVGPLAAACSGWPAGLGTDRWGATRMRRWGLIGMAVGCLLLALADSVPGYLGPLVLLTSSYAVSNTSNQSVGLSAAPPEHRGVTSGLLSLSRNLGLLTGASIMGTLFSWGVGQPHLPTASAAAIQRGMQINFGGAALLACLALWTQRWKSTH